MQRWPTVATSLQGEGAAATAGAESSPTAAAAAAAAAFSQPAPEGGLYPPGVVRHLQPPQQQASKSFNYQSDYSGGTNNSFVPSVDAFNVSRDRPL